MAKFIIHNIIKLGMRHKHTATDWQVALDKDFSQIIDQSINDKVNLLEWHSPLKRIDGQPGLYSDEEKVYARFRTWFKNECSDWLVLTDNQNYQEVIITQDGKDPIYTNSDDIDMQ